MTEKEPMGLLFDSIAYYTPEDINKLTDNLTFEQSFYVLTQALEYAHKARLYDLRETELVSKSIRIVNTHLTKTEE
jgi:hypothetical protein